ncbi:MAG TPA: FHA domain-containing protein [Ignavibacteria bacterium]
MKCKVCNGENEADSRFCVDCGSPLLRDSTKVCANGHIYSSNLNKCPFCPSDDLKRKAGINNLFSEDDTSTFFTNKSDKTTKIIQSQEKSAKSRTIIVGSESDNFALLTHGRILIGWLVTFTWVKEGEDFKIFEGRNLISGSPNVEIYLNDPAVSSPHCMILSRAGIIKIKDEMSTNGTFINGTEISEAELFDGDILKIGKTELLFRTVQKP